MAANADTANFTADPTTQQKGSSAASSAEEGTCAAGTAPPPSGSSSGFPIPNVPMWTMHALGSLLYLLVPFYKRALQIEGAVEATFEEVAEDVVKVATVVEKVASQVADSLPKDSIVENDFVLVEHWAEIVAEDARKAEAFVHKVDEITKRVDERVEPIISELEAIQIVGPGIAS